MKNEKTTKTEPRKEKTNYPVSTPVEYQDKTGSTKTSWSNIGTAFEGEKGMTVHLNALPVNGKLFINKSLNL